MKKYWVRTLGTVGSLLAIQTIFWEYARMHPQYGFIVDPWSIRGYETVHGAIIASIGVVALVAFFLVAWNGSEQPSVGAGIIGFVVVAATAIAAIFGGGNYEFTPGFFQIAVVTIVVGTILYRLMRSATAASVIAQNSWLRLLTLLVIFGGVALLINATVGGKEQSLPQWAIIAILFLLMAGLSLSSQPRQLAANRMLMFSSVGAAAAIAMSAGAVRSTLIRFQAEAGGLPASYRDTQVTAGHLMGVLGMALVFFAAVSLWARRRDAILTAARADKQRAAAEASAAEIAAALEKAGQRG